MSIPGEKVFEKGVYALKYLVKLAYQLCICVMSDETLKGFLGQSIYNQDSFRPTSVLIFTGVCINTAL